MSAKQEWGKILLEAIFLKRILVARPSSSSSSSSSSKTSTSTAAMPAAAALTHLVLRTINFFYSTWLVIEIDSACVCVMCVCERDREGGRERALRPVL